MTGSGALIASTSGDFVLSEAEIHAIRHEMEHYEDPRAASIEALKIAILIAGKSSIDVEAGGTGEVQNVFPQAVPAAAVEA